MEHKFKKKYGQNFLQDENIINKIANSLYINRDDMIIEIGPGSGALTNELLKKTNKLLCFEVDTELEKYLNKYRENGATIIYGDFLKQDVNSILKNFRYKNLYIIANLPYYITTPIITKIINDNIPADSCVFMVQKEVADRLRAKPNTKQYNSLTIFIEYYFEVEKLFDVSKNVFFPKPNVDSTVIMLKRRKNNIVEVKNEKLFFKLIRDSFTFKRKTLKNNLKNYDLEKINSILKKHNYGLNCRAEELDIKIFSEIANVLS